MSNTADQNDPVSAAVIVGKHPFDVPSFHQLFRSLPRADCYLQHMELFVTSPPEIRHSYDVLIFYNMHQATPGEGDGPFAEAEKAVFDELGGTDQGLLLLHHSILAYPEWSKWSEIVGIDDRSFEFYIGETLQVEVADSDHPITRGVGDWEMVDETYAMAGPGEDSHVLLTTDHPKSMESLAWTREYGNSRVFCLQSGHDNATWQNPNFRTILANGIQWAGVRI